MFNYATLYVYVVNQSIYIFFILIYGQKSYYIMKCGTN